MTPEIRLELLKISRPNVDNPDLQGWLAKARELEAYVHGAGQPANCSGLVSDKAVQQTAATQVSSQVRTPRKAKPEALASGKT